LKMTEGLYILLNTDKNLYASLFDFADPWKIDIMNFRNRTTPTTSRWKKWPITPGGALPHSNGTLVK